MIHIVEQVAHIAELAGKKDTAVEGGGLVFDKLEVVVRMVDIAGMEWVAGLK